MFLTGAGVAVTFGAGVGVTVGDVHPLTETTIMPININNNNAFVIFLVNFKASYPPIVVMSWHVRA
jgi:hypothetical protein